MDNIAISSRVSVFIIKWSFGYLSTGSHSGPQRYIRTRNEPELSGEPCSPIVAHGPGPWASLSVSGAPLAWKTTNKMSTTWQYLGKAVVAYCSLWQVFHSMQSWSPFVWKTTLTIKKIWGQNSNIWVWLAGQYAISAYGPSPEASLSVSEQPLA